MEIYFLVASGCRTPMVRKAGEYGIRDSFDQRAAR